MTALRIGTLGCVLLAALLPTCPAAAETVDGFGDLSRASAPARAAKGTQAASRADIGEIEERLHLLWVAISRARNAIWEASRDSEGRHFLDPDYVVNEARSDLRGHGLLAGSLFVSPVVGKGTSRPGKHDFYFDAALADRLEEPLLYLRSGLEKAPAHCRELLDTYAAELKRIRELKLTVDESQWKTLPTVGLKAVLVIEARTNLLWRLVDAVRKEGKPIEVTAAIQRQMRAMLDFDRSALGVSADGKSIDLARASSAYGLETKGSVLRGRQHVFRLKGELTGALLQAIDMKDVKIGGSDNKLSAIDAIKWAAVDDLFRNVVIPAGLPFLENPEAHARKIIGRRVFLVHASVTALADYLGCAKGEQAD